MFWHNLFFCTILQYFVIIVKNAFSGLFFHNQKGGRVFQWQEDINVVVASARSSTKPVSQFLEILIFSKDTCGIVHYVPEINLISYRTLIKTFYLLSKTNWKKSETQFCRQKTAENSNAKINISPNIPCTFLLFKAGVFLQIFFPRNLLFQQVLRTPVFLNSI